MARLADHEIIPAVLAKIEHLDWKVGVWKRIHSNPISIRRDKGFAKAADRLRDFATVELLCEGLGITRKEIE